MKIHIEDLRFSCIIGILDFERESEQEVVVNIDIEYDYENGFVDYAKVADLVKKTMIEEKFFLIEDALNKIGSILMNKNKTIKNIKIKIDKPSILEGCSVGVSNHYTAQS